MDPEEIKEVCVKSADDMLAYSEFFGASESVVRVRRYVLSGKGHVILYLESPVSDTSGVYLRVGDDVFDSSCVEFSFCDPRSKTLGIRFTQGRTDVIFEERPGVEVVVDLSFLVRNTKEYYERYGSLVRYPDWSPSFSEEEYPFPEGKAPTDRQRAAVRTILNSRMSYVWGAPGTGKTQLVLATAIMAYMRRGMRVAVIAPTNNAVEQVLRGLVSAISGDQRYSSAIDLGKDIARIGSPTPSFVREFPGMCEVRAAEAVLRTEAKEKEVLKHVLSERNLDRARCHFLDCISLLEINDSDGARGEAERIIDILGDGRRFAQARGYLERLDLEGIRYCYGKFYSRDRPLKDID